MSDNLNNDVPLVNGNRASVVNNPPAEENPISRQNCSNKNGENEELNSIPDLVRQLTTELSRLNSRIQTLEELMVSCNSVLLTVLETLGQLTENIAMLNNNDHPSNEP